MVEDVVVRYLDVQKALKPVEFVSRMEEDSGVTWRIAIEEPRAWGSVPHMEENDNVK